LIRKERDIWVSGAFVCAHAAGGGEKLQPSGFAVVVRWVFLCRLPSLAGLFSRCVLAMDEE